MRQQLRGRGSLSATDALPARLAAQQLASLAGMSRKVQEALLHSQAVFQRQASVVEQAVLARAFWAWRHLHASQQQRCAAALAARRRIETGQLRRCLHAWRSQCGRHDSRAAVLQHAAARLRRGLLHRCWQEWRRLVGLRAWKLQVEARDQQILLLGQQLRHLESRPVRYMARRLAETMQRLGAENEQLKRENERLARVIDSGDWSRQRVQELLEAGRVLQVERDALQKLVGAAAASGGGASIGCWGGCSGAGTGGAGVPPLGDATNSPGAVPDVACSPSLAGSGEYEGGLLQRYRASAAGTQPAAAPAAHGGTAIPAAWGGGAGGSRQAGRSSRPTSPAARNKLLVKSGSSFNAMVRALKQDLVTSGALARGTGPAALYEVDKLSLNRLTVAGDGAVQVEAVSSPDRRGVAFGMELRQLFVGSSNMATSPAGANCTGGSSGGGIVPTPAVSPILPSISPTVPPISPTPTTPGGGGGLAPANPSNTILSSVRMNVKAVSCPMWNGTAFGTDTKYWAASAKPAAIDWDKAMELVNKLCASPALAGPTLLAAFEKPGTAEANTSVAASIQSCPGSGDTTWLGWLYIKTANPQDDHSDGSQAVSYAQKWVAAADAAGYALCVAVGQFDPSWALVGALHLVHNPTPWSGSNKPGFSGVFNAWVLPHPDVPGQPAACKAWNGTNPASVDQTQFKAYVSAICGNEATAGATLAAAIKAGSPTAQMAAYTMLYKCTDNSTIGLSQAAWDAASPFTSMDTQGAVSFAKAWRDALDAIDYPLCVTVTFWENGAMLNQTQVHPFGEKAVGHGSGDGGISPPVITSPVIIPPAITFNRSA
ncbi:centriole proteome [Chlorella sorokiniana]|uniref:Centriole proteome n=1 Tax=Chlorella sorokiniana TaxID=3076 RepID=A0A2P6TLI7_CHLSO|nr:centriole proteome [Chlorella sorokiniana]|eukprot:PRW45153.1 centriole proteome [Chlorella sorokiniana]